MEIKKTVTKQLDVVSDIVCDSCGKSCIDTFNMNHEYMTLSAQWGYGAKHDMQTWEAQVCETCVVEKLEPLIYFLKHGV